MRIWIVVMWLFAGTGVVASAEDSQSRVAIDVIMDYYPVQYTLLGETTKTFPRPVSAESFQGITFTNADMIPVGSNQPPDMSLLGSVKFLFPQYSVSFGVNTHYEKKVDAFGTTRVYLEISNQSDRPLSVDFGQLQIIKDGSSIPLRNENNPVLAFVPARSKVRQYYSVLNLRDQLLELPGPRVVRKDEDLSPIENSLGRPKGFRIFFPFGPNEVDVRYFDAEIYAESYRILNNNS